ncbi:MAG: nucleotide disphospho-sugar-binding domain-containing protein [Acidimicrobiia bacterium]
MATRSILVLLSTAGGGDRQPVVSLATSLHQSGHRVTILCDRDTAAMAAATGLPSIIHDVEQVGYISGWARSLAEDPAPPNPFLKWGRLAHVEVRQACVELDPDLIVSSLFCMGLADLLAEDLSIPWCLVNPSFYFGEHSTRTWEEDWHGPLVPRLARECFTPLVDRADLVLHATDPLFDVVPAQLPTSHHYVGFLLWEPTQAEPDFLRTPGDPWALVTASTSRPSDEETMLRTAVGALTGRPVRTVLTLPRHDSDAVDFPGALVTGHAPHTPILRQSALAINQAGHGIVSKCLTYGVPMVLLPWDADQPGVAARAAGLGVAAVVPRESISSHNLSQAVGEVLDGAGYRQAAAAVSSALADRRPAEQAVALVEEL